MDQKTHIAIFPSLPISHLIPFIEFAKRLVLDHHNFHVTCLLLTTTEDHISPSRAKMAILDSLPAAIDIIFLPPVNLDDLPEDHKLRLTITRSLSSLQTTLKSLLITNRLDAFFADLFGFEAIEIAKGLNVPSFIFFTSNALSLALFLHLPNLDHELLSSVRFLSDLPDPIQLPGCVPLPSNTLMDTMQDRESKSYKSLLNLSKGLYLTEGRIVNIFLAMEFEAIKALEANDRMPRVFLVGPIVKKESSDDHDKSECMTWLDKQPRGSVLYVSFGSGGTLSSDQMNELAFGLEMSGKNFLWVTRRPNNESSSANFLKQSSRQSQSQNQSQDKYFDYLPSGFFERTKGRGLVVESWVPQARVLSHGSTGGFMSHCGWSSILESIVNGVPLIVWPLYAEQKMNAVMLVEELHVAMRLSCGENGIVGRDEIVRGVKEIMDQSCEEGKKVGKCMNELKNDAIMALGEDGSSKKALSELAFMLLNKASN
ncbi:hypothetical protein G4B88_030161 [Cannabis sativa]|uniref:Glycosyltransferase n=1 Tax=Cannabis sativa TaxID=3483 RepID=A0A7J6E1U7_CANSA|nr:hypothetical protein G4B88_030161 [Cannabis sativa]